MMNEIAEGLKAALDADEVGVASYEILAGGEADNGGRRVSIVVDAPSNADVEGPFEPIRQMVINLIDNAVKYTPAGGRVAVRARAVGDRVRIEVADDGPGIGD